MMFTEDYVDNLENRIDDLEDQVIELEKQRAVASNNARFYADRCVELEGKLANERSRLDYITSIGDIGLLAIDNDLEGVNIRLHWNAFGIAGVPSTLREAIDLSRKFNQDLKDSE